MIHHARWADLSPVVLHDLVRLRIDVFVVEQQCPYAELDGRDVEADTVQVWAENAGVLTGCLRVLTEPDGSRRIGRVCVAAAARGRGIARSLLVQGLRMCDGHDVVLDAQSPVVGWYENLGFVATGPEFLEDGIPHVPMRHRAR